MRARVHVIVSGIVQGVGFRFFIYNISRELNLSGFVRNLFSGEVEIEAEGERSLIEELITMVKTGPRSAHVTDLKINWIKCEDGGSNFEVR
jgi:acylphosphatase